MCSRHLTKAIAALEIVTNCREHDEKYVKKEANGGETEDESIEKKEEPKEEQEKQEEPLKLEEPKENPEADGQKETPEAGENQLEENQDEDENAPDVVAPGLSAPIAIKDYSAGIEKENTETNELAPGLSAPVAIKDYKAEFEKEKKIVGENVSFKAFKYAVEIRYRGHVSFWKNVTDKEKVEDA